jgi:RNA recognition motif-containing protein
MPDIGDKAKKKRKLQEAQIEIDISAPEPPSKKALRRAKKKGIDAVPVTPETKAEGTSSAPPDKRRSGYGVWIGNLPFLATKDDLRRFFTSNCSFTETTITRVHLPAGTSKPHGKAQNKGFAYVDFSTKKALDEALGLSEQLLSGRRVLIKDAQNFEGRPEQHQQAGSSKTSAAASNPPSRRIFVGNLGFDATKESLEEHLSSCGVITDIHMATFEDSGKCKGYAWIGFERLEAAETAVQGSVTIEEDDPAKSSESEPVEDPPAQAKKARTRKIRVNRFLGRQLRIEFAEEATTRYKKRFGKTDRTQERDMNPATSTSDPLPYDVKEAIIEVSPHPHSPVRTVKKPTLKTEKRHSSEQSKYPRESQRDYARLTGAIVESQGAKITFD